MSHESIYCLTNLVTSSVYRFYLNHGSYSEIVFVQINGLCIKHDINTISLNKPTRNYKGG